MGAISYVEFARRMFPPPGKADAEINHLTAALVPGKNRQAVTKVALRV